jgi:site-specific recombinase XerD
MKGLTKEGSRPYAWQRAIPQRFRDLFNGNKKHVVSLKTHDLDEARKRALLAQREFEEKCGFSSKPIQVELASIAGLVFDDVMHRPNGMTPREAILKGIARHKRNEHPLIRGFPDAGPTVDRVVEMTEKMWRAYATQDARLRAKVSRQSLTMDEQAEEWKKTNPPLTAKTVDQYVHDVREFSRWYEGAREDIALGSAITKREVNEYVAHRMRLNEPKNTIYRRLSGLMKVYKSGQFSDDNPFANVSSRIDIHGPELIVRKLTDEECRLIMVEAKEFDLNVQWITRIALYSGMRLSEVCSLLVEDIKSVMVGKEKVHYFAFDRKKGRTAKNPFSYRDIPMHSAYAQDLFRLVRGRTSGFIFDESADNKYKSRSAAISKRLNRMIRRVAPDRAAREHSFRHTVISKLADQGVRSELRKALVGHTGGDAHDGYVHAQRIRELHEAVKTISY